MADKTDSMRWLRGVAHALLLLTAPLVAFAQDGAGNVVGKMGAQAIKSVDLKRLLDALPPDARKRIATDLGALDRLVREELVRQFILTEAKTQGWDKKPDVQFAMKRARDQALLLTYMNNLARPSAAYPSEDEIKAVYDASKASLTVPPEYQLSQIYVSSPESADRTVATNAEKKVTDIMARLQKAPTDFGKIANESSDHKESRANGGDLGWLTETQLIPEVRFAVARMNTGEISAPIRTATGWHIVRLSDRKPSTVRPLSEVREQIVANMRLRKAQEAERAYVDGLVTKSSVTVNQVELQKLQARIK